VVAVEAGGRRLTVRHAAIPGLMPAMTMPFPVRGRSRAAAGERIAARLVVTKSDSWLEEVTVVGRAPAAGVARRPAAYAPRREGERLSEFRLTDQDGRRVTLRDLRGKTVAITFIYTRCPLPNFCPLLSERFAEVQRRIRPLPLRRRVTLLSVSFDPEYDTPARLRDYGRRFHADPGFWRLLTGSPQQVEALASELGVVYAPDQGMINHNLETTVLDGGGRVVRRFSGNDWAVASLVTELERVSGEEARRPGGSQRSAHAEGRAL
jgi:protein SCO1/2